VEEKGSKKDEGIREGEKEREGVVVGEDGRWCTIVERNGHSPLMPAHLRVHCTIPKTVPHAHELNEVGDENQRLPPSISF
jgi:hypothetical protein